MQIAPCLVSIWPLVVILQSASAKWQSALEQPAEEIRWVGRQVKTCIVQVVHSVHLTQNAALRLVSSATLVNKHKKLDLLAVFYCEGFVAEKKNRSVADRCRGEGCWNFQLGRADACCTDADGKRHDSLMTSLSCSILVQCPRKTKETTSLRMTSSEL